MSRRSTSRSTAIRANHYIHNAALTQAGDSVSGTGNYAVGEPWRNTWQVTDATVVGNGLT